jgi:chloramphenicol 3-O-phosphotransferase
MHTFSNTGRRRPASMAIVAAAALVALSGCAANGGDPGKTSDDPALQAIMDAGVINVGVSISVFGAEIP